MSGNPFFPLDELGFDNEENQMMVIPKVDKEIYDQRRKMAGTMVDYKEMRMRYSCAIKEVRTKFDVLNSEFNVGAYPLTDPIITPLTKYFCRKG